MRALAIALAAPLLIGLEVCPSATETATANGETRTINLTDSHTDEAGSFTYMVDGVYDQSVLDKLNWFMRDWRHDEQTKMDPKLFDIVWEVYRESGSTQPVDVLSGYRSPETNAMLRRRSRQVAEHSQHMLGKAMDAHFIDVPTARIRDIGMRLQSGGVGFYPTGGTPWVHLDAGSVRYWPRMSHDQIARLFPDGKTVFIPSDGVPLPGYQQAAAEIEARGGAVYMASAETGRSRGLLATLFGGGEDEEEEGGAARGAIVAASPSARGGGGAQTFFTAQYQAAGAPAGTPGRTVHDPAHGEPFLGAPEPGSVFAAGAQKPQLVAALERPATGAAAAPGATAAPVPPHRPSELAGPEFGLAAAPTPPSRPIEFASLLTTVSDAAPGPTQGAARALRKSDLIAAVLARKLPGVITQGGGSALPAGALALAEVEDPPQPPGRPAPLTKAAALAAVLPPAGSPRLSPLARAALLFADLPPARRVDSGIALVPARIDRSNFSLMTAAPTYARKPAGWGAPLGASPLDARSELQLAMLAPALRTPAGFAKQPYGDLRSDAFTGAAVPQSGEAAAALDPFNLRGPTY
ncbi:MAG: DUF882 domain-containing protein [Roseiarcus sp.]